MDNSAFIIQRFIQSLIQNKNKCEFKFTHPELYSKKQLLECIKFNLMYYKHRSILFTFFVDDMLRDTFNDNIKQASKFIYSSFKLMNKTQLVNMLQKMTNEESYMFNYCDTCFPDDERMEMVNPHVHEYYDNHRNYYHRNNNNLSRYEYDSTIASSRHYLQPHLPQDIINEINSYIPYNNNFRVNPGIESINSIIKRTLDDSVNATPQERVGLLTQMYKHINNNIDALKNYNYRRNNLRETLILKAMEYMNQPRATPELINELNTFLTLIGDE
jgi:hypothetical protein